MQTIKELFYFQLGVDKPFITRISAVCIAILSFFYTFFITSFFNLDVFILENRVMYDVTIVNSFFVIDKNIDVIISGVLAFILLFLLFKNRFKIIIPLGFFSLLIFSFLFHNDLIKDLLIIISFPIIIFLYLLSFFNKIKIINTNQSISLPFTYFSILLIGLCIYSLSLSTLKIVGIIPLNEHLPDYSFNLFVIISRLSPFIVILLSVVLLFNLVTKWLKNNANIHRINHIKKLASHDTIKLDIGFNIHTKLILTLIVSLSILISIIPQLHTVNPENRYVGVDTFWYVNWTSSFENSSPLEIISHAFIEQSHGDRPVSLFIIYAISRIIPTSTGDAIDSLPIILSPILILVIYFLTKEITRNIKISLLVSFLTVFSFQVLIGIYAGFYANWLGLIIGNISLIFLFRYLRTRLKSNLILFAIFFVLLVFTHVYTWTIYLFAILIFSIISLKLKMFPINQILLILFILGLTVSTDVVKDIIIGSSGGVQENIKLTEEFIGLNNTSILIKNLHESVLISHGGIFGNGVVLLFVLVFSIFYLNIRRISDLLIISFLTLLIVPVFLGYWNIQVRVLYDIPFQIPFGIAIYYLTNYTKNAYLFLALIMLQTSIGVRTLVNFYLIES